MNYNHHDLRPFVIRVEDNREHRQVLHKTFVLYPAVLMDTTSGVSVVVENPLESVCSKKYMQVTSVIRLKIHLEQAACCERQSSALA